VADDCPSNDECHCVKKSGLTLFGGNTGSKDVHITMASALPMEKIKSYGAWGPEVEIERVTFQDFAAKTRCGNKQVVFKRNKSASDYIPLHKMKSCTFVDVEDGAFAKFDESPENWANVSDCGEWPCTAPENIVMNF
jgi:hypothetical protein